MGRQARKIRNREHIAGRRHGCFRFLFLALLIVIALIFLWPVDKTNKVKTPHHSNRSKSLPLPAAAGEKTIGRAAYRVVSAVPVKNLPGFNQTSKTTPVVVIFTLRNLARFGRTPNINMFALVDESDSSYLANEDMTLAWYKWQRQALLWDKEIAPGQSRKLAAVFVVSKGPVKDYSLAAQDIDWRSNKKINLPVGKISTR